MNTALVMPYVLAFNRTAIEARIERLAAYCGIAGGFDGFAATILDLRRTLGVPNTLPELLRGETPDAARRSLIVDMAVVDPTAGGNPIELTKDAAAAMLDAAIDGRV